MGIVDISNSQIPEGKYERNLPPFKTKQNLMKLFSKIEIPTKNAMQFSPSRYEMFEIFLISPENAINNR